MVSQECVAVLQRMADDYAILLADSTLPDDFYREALTNEHAALTAAIEALQRQGEPVAWQYRFVMKDTDYWSGWCQVMNVEALRLIVSRYKKHGFKVESRALYAHPPQPPTGEQTP